MKVKTAAKLVRCSVEFLEHKWRAVRAEEEYDEACDNHRSASAEHEIALKDYNGAWWDGSSMVPAPDIGDVRSFTMYEDNAVAMRATESMLELVIARAEAQKTYEVRRLAMLRYQVAWSRLLTHMIYAQRESGKGWAYRSDLTDGAPSIKP